MGFSSSDRAGRWDSRAAGGCTLGCPRVAVGLARWENERRSSELPPRRIVFLTSRLQTAIDKQAQGASWVDKGIASVVFLAKNLWAESLRSGPRFDALLNRVGHPSMRSSEATQLD
jgi:hypothetical protein